MFLLLLLLVTLFPPDGQAFSPVLLGDMVGVPGHTFSMTTTTKTTTSPPCYHHHSMSFTRLFAESKDDNDNDEEGVVIQPTIMVNGEDQHEHDPRAEITEDEAAKAARNKEIMGATAAMAIKTETPMEDTLKHVQDALMDLELINERGEPYQTPEAVAPLVQGQRVGLYFGAGWCPMCRELEFMLPQYSKALEESAQPIQLIYVSSDASLEFQLDRMAKLGLQMGVPPKVGQKLKAQYGIWSGRESPDFSDCGTTRRSGVPAFIVLDTKKGEELKFLDAESQTIAALADWPLDDPLGIF